MPARRRVESVRVVAMILADGRAMLSWWSSTSSPKWILDRSIHGAGPKVVGSTKALSMPARLAMSYAVSRQLFLRKRWAWGLVHRPESPCRAISSDRLATRTMKVSWRWQRAFSYSLAMVISAWSASGCKSIPLPLPLQLLEFPVALTDEQSALVSSRVSRVRWRQHIHVHRWYSCETEKLSWRQPSSFLSSVAGLRCVDVRNGILLTCRSFVTMIDLVQLFPRLLSQCCTAISFSSMHLYTV